MTVVPGTTKAKQTVGVGVLYRKLHNGLEELLTFGNSIKNAFDFGFYNKTQNLKTDFNFEKCALEMDFN